MADTPEISYLKSKGLLYATDLSSDKAFELARATGHCIFRLSTTKPGHIILTTPGAHLDLSEPGALMRAPKNDVELNRLRDSLRSVAGKATLDFLPVPAMADTPEISYLKSKGLLYSTDLSSDKAFELARAKEQCILRLSTTKPGHIILTTPGAHLDLSEPAALWRAPKNDVELNRLRDSLRSVAGKATLDFLPVSAVAGLSHGGAAGGAGSAGADEDPSPPSPGMG